MEQPHMPQTGKMRSMRNNRTMLWIWGVSVSLHIAAMTVLAFVHVGSEGNTWDAPPTSRIAEVQELIQSEPVLPRPRVTPPQHRRETMPVLDSQTLLADDGRDYGRAIVSSAGPAAQVAYFQPRVEFFGSVANERRVCFVVDASGSMLGMFSLVKNTLIESVNNLEADHYFSIIFFNRDLYESSPGMLRRASPSAKSEVAEFILTAGASGPSRPLPALESAMTARDVTGHTAGVIYFLTDGFDLGRREADEFAGAVRRLRQGLAPEARINTIGFWTNEADSIVLQTIAEESGGEFVSLRN